MKNVVFSFDDGRLDTYTEAIPILEKYNFHGVVNVISDFVIHPNNYENEVQPCCSMSVEMVKELYANGHEIACHGHTHRNTVDDIKNNIREFENWGISVENIGFASPFSEINLNNTEKYRELYVESGVKYIRSGTQTRREGLFYSIFSAIEQILHSSTLFWLLNKRCIYKYPANTKYIRGISVKKNTTPRQILHIINIMPDDSSIVLIFHSIVPNVSDFPDNRWVWKTQNLEELCQTIFDDSNVSVKTNSEIV